MPIMRKVGESLSRKWWFWFGVVFGLANLALFWQFYFRGLLPFPGDLLVSFFFPWNSGGFVGFDPWTTRKQFIAADAIRQIFLWKDLAFDLVRQGRVPLWNPYNFSGTPLLANLQSSVFFPGNALYLILPAIWAWIAQVIGLLPVLGLGVFLFLRSCGLSLPAAIFGALVGAHGSYLLSYQEILVNVQTMLFLPWALWLARRFVVAKRSGNLLLVSLCLAGAIFGGHMQNFVFVAAIVFLFLVGSGVGLFKTALVMILPLGLGAVQLWPAFEAYQLSAREAVSNAELLTRSLLPWGNWATVFAPDFYGNPATNNFRGFDYADGRMYFGVVALVFAVVGLVFTFSQKTSRLFAFIALGAVLTASYPLGHLWSALGIPVLSSGLASRQVVVFEFAAAILSAFGFDYWWKRTGARPVSGRPILFLVAIYFLLWLVTFVKGTPDFLVSRRNLVIPSGVFMMAAFGFFLPLVRPRLKSAALVFLVLLAIAEYGYFFNKLQPFAPAKFVFPEHPILTFLQKNAGIDRFFGFGTAYLDKNFATYFRIYDPEGYDPIYSKRYGELVASTFDGKLPREVRRSDAAFTSEDNFYRNRLFDLLGVKYILDKNDFPGSNWEPEYHKFPADRYELVWQNYKWKVYRRLSALARVQLVGKYDVVAVGERVIERIYDRDFDGQKTVILEKDPGILAQVDERAKAEVADYRPDRVVVRTSSTKPQILFLSDAFFPGWRVFVDRKEGEVLRANYALRAVAVSAGDHEVVFAFEPASFSAGLVVSFASFGLWLGLLWRSLGNTKAT